MLEFLHSVASVLLILLLTALGYGMTALGWLKPEAKSFLSRFLLRIIVPCYCIYGLRTHLTRDAVLAAGAFLAVPLISSLLLIGLSVLAGRLLKLPRRSLGVFIALCSVSNAFFIGYPMWWYTIPMLLDTFFDSYDFTGKTVVPFATSGSSGIGDSYKNIQELAPGAKVFEGQRFAASVSEDKLAAWAEQF